MTIDGFRPALSSAFTGYEGRVADLCLSATSSVSDLLRVEMTGLENLPKGRALLVMNHAFGWDAMLPIAAIWRATGRRVWALGEHLWWKIPFLRRLAASTGAVDGTQENLDALLARDELVLVLPGGLREAMKPKELRYRLLWGHRDGFVRGALRNHAPLVPLAGIGADDIFELVGDAYARGRKWLHTDFPIPRIGLGTRLLHRPELKYVIGAPVSTASFPGEDTDAAVERLRLEVRGGLEQLIDEGLATRMGLHT